MDEQRKELIRAIEREWFMDTGFLGKVREGAFDVKEGDQFVQFLDAIRLPEQDEIDRRLVSLLWYIPIFLSWQKERVVERGGDAEEFTRLTDRALASVQRILGVP